MTLIVTMMRMTAAKLPLLLLLLLLACCPAANARMMEIQQPEEMTRQECVESGGIVVPDVGDGSSRLPEYRCASNGKAITGLIYTLPDEWPSDEGEVCCGGGGAPAGDNASLLPFFTSEQCQDMNGEVVGDIGNGAIFEPDYVCSSNGKKPFGIIVSLPNDDMDGAPVAVEGSICCGPPIGGFVPPTMSRDDCTQLGGLIIYDRGDGSSRLPEYRCDSNGLAIIGIVVALPGQAMSFEGEVCCGPPPIAASLPLQEFTRQECLKKNGVVVGDIGDGVIHREDFLCESTGESILAIIVPAEGEPIALEGEVCCGLLGETETDTPMIVNRQECTNDLNGIIVYDRGDGSSRRPGYLCESSGEPILAVIVPAEGEPISREGEVCCGAEPDTPMIVNRQECTNELNGIIVLDIGNGSSRRPGYLCESSGEPILAIIVPAEGEPIAREGAVCCGAEPDTPMIVNRQECTNDLNGIIVLDIGDGSSRRPGYRCKSSGEPILAIIVPAEGEPIAREGAVCCGLADDEDEVGEHCNLFCQLSACSNSLRDWIGDHFGRD